VLVMEPEEPARCEECGKIEELRPYGKDGARVCYSCGTSTPERKAEAERRFEARLRGEEPVSRCPRS